MTHAARSLGLFAFGFAFLVTSAPQKANAEIVYLIPIVGAEWVGAGDTVFSAGDGFIGARTRLNEVGLALGGHAGLALGPFRIGALYQRAFMFDRNDGLHLDKLYAELGIGVKIKFVGIMATVAGGYAFAGTQYTGITHGAGGRITGAVDFYLNKWVSLGPELSFDVTGYFPTSGVRITTYGLTPALRIGVHI